MLCYHNPIKNFTEKEGEMISSWISLLVVFYIRKSLKII